MSREWLGTFMAEMPCPTCGGKRLNEQALSVYVGGKNIYEWTDNERAMRRLCFMRDLEADPAAAGDRPSDRKGNPGSLAVFWNNVGLGYLTLDRIAGSLSGGEAQRIRLATQIGSHLSGVLVCTG